MDDRTEVNQSEFDYILNLCKDSVSIWHELRKRVLAGDYDNTARPTLEPLPDEVCKLNQVKGNIAKILPSATGKGRIGDLDLPNSNCPTCLAASEVMYMHNEFLDDEDDICCFCPVRAWREDAPCDYAMSDYWVVSDAFRYRQLTEDHKPKVIESLDRIIRHLESAVDEKELATLLVVSNDRRNLQ